MRQDSSIFKSARQLINLSVSKRAFIIIIFVFIFISTILIFDIGYSVEWTGFKEYNAQSPKKGEYYQPEKKLWDWMSLLIVPLALAVGGFLFTNSQGNRDQKKSDDNIRESTLQSYIDQISELLLDYKLRESIKDSETRDIARTRTLVALNRLDSTRKGILLRFLQEADLVGRDDEKNIIDLRRADLREADLRGQDLSFISLINVFLEKADLSGCTLTGSDLRNAKMRLCQLNTTDLSSSDLREANLEKANLDSVNLERSDLRLASLRKANLRGAILINTDLRQTDLCGADLRDAVLSGSDLAGAKYDRKTKFPKGPFNVKEMILSK